ncbi:hypothetical protein [Anabaena sp. UHCC 0204]|uniref:hypothetical protein n=1 Tax=Anabaena sp. UHCC 0204 TaxID=2590009 RepID=UPI001444BFB2|nr:hypothetical protein [Anabaena sp. UHCC 0204]MTJ10616.1 hypothetical protein [Anabaena sp. UHCC 0204]
MKNIFSRHTYLSLYCLFYNYITRKRSHPLNTPKQRSHPSTSLNSDRTPTPQTAIALPHPKSDRTLTTSQNAIASPDPQNSDRPTSTSLKQRSHPLHPQKAIALSQIS